MGNKVTRAERDQQYRELKVQLEDQAWAILNEEAPFTPRLEVLPVFCELMKALRLLAKDDLAVFHLGFD